MIDEIQELMNHTKKDGSTNWVDGDEIRIKIGRAHVRTPVTRGSRMPSTA